MTADLLVLADAADNRPSLSIAPAKFCAVAGSLVVQAGRQSWVIEPDRLADLHRMLGARLHLDNAGDGAR